MRLTGLILLLLLALPAFCGCLQRDAGPEPATTVPSLTTTPAIQTPAPILKKEINVTAYESEHAVIVRYDGGKDANGLVMLNVQIDNRDGKIVKTPIYSPEIGREYPFRYVGVVNADTINIIGVFSDGTQQTVLIQYF